MEARIRTIVDELVDAVIDRGEMDVVKDLAYPLPVTVISEMLGIPEEDRHLLNETASAVIKFQDIGGTPADHRRADEITLRFNAMIRREIEDRRRSPRSDLMTAMAAAEENGDMLSADELVSTCFTLSAAGHETTVNLIASLLYSLLQDRALWERILAEPRLIPSAIEEGLRFDAPLRMLTARYPEQDVEIAGVRILAGEQVRMFVGAANFDENVFDDPDTFLIERKPNRHVAFNVGKHFCIGAKLARLETQLVLEALARRLPGIELGDRPAEWAPSISMRSLATLPIKWPA